MCHSLYSLIKQFILEQLKVRNINLNFSIFLCFLIKNFITEYLSNLITPIKDFFLSSPFSFFNNLPPFWKLSLEHRSFQGLERTIYIKLKELKLISFIIQRDKKNNQKLFTLFYFHSSKSEVGSTLYNLHLKTFKKNYNFCTENIDSI